MVRIAQTSNKVIFRESSYMAEIQGEYKFPAVIGVIAKKRRLLKKKSMTFSEEDNFNAGKLSAFLQTKMPCFCIVKPGGFLSIRYVADIHNNLNIMYVADFQTHSQRGSNSQKHIHFPWKDVMDFRPMRTFTEHNLTISLPNHYITFEAVNNVNFLGSGDNKRFVNGCLSKYQTLGLEFNNKMSGRDYGESFVTWLGDIFKQKESQGKIKSLPDAKFPRCQEHRFTADLSPFPPHYACPKCKKDLSVQAVWLDKF